MINIPEIIKTHHQAMIDKGFYDECDCNEGHGYNCDICKGTGSLRNKNVEEMLMMIIGELGEALEAHRNKRFSMKGEIEYVCSNIDFKSSLCVGYETNVKDTFEDEIADVFLRIFSLCGYLNMIPSPAIPDTFKYNTENIGEILLQISQEILNIKNYGYVESNFSRAIYFLWCAAVNNWNIPIEKHIMAKMAYNKTREHKHGKEY